MKPNSRRFFLYATGLAVVGGTLALPALRAFRVVPENPHTPDEMRAYLLKHIPFSRNSAAAINAFLIDYSVHRRLMSDEFTIESRFLLSTDFFPDENENRPLTYIMFFDPYVNPCYNPLRI